MKYDPHIPQGTMDRISMCLQACRNFETHELRDDDGEARDLMHELLLAKPTSLPDAWACIARACRQDHSFAWGVHCNIAMPIKDSGVDHLQANLAAAAVMLYMHDMDMNTVFEYRELIQRMRGGDDAAE